MKTSSFYWLVFVVIVFISDAKAATVFPIATNGNVSQAGIGIAFGGTNYLVGIQGDAAAHYNITAQLVSTNGSLLGSRIAIGRTGGIPKVGFDGTNYLVTWPDDALYPTNVIYGQLISRSGAVAIRASANGLTSANVGSCENR